MPSGCAEEPPLSTEITVSVVTVTRNDRDGLKKTVESVRSQTHAHIEHVIVDGASSDGTKEYLGSLSHAASVSEPDGGIFDAMNKGMRMATGNVLVFMNSGDIFSTTTTVAYVVSHWDASGPSWGYGGMRYIDSNGVAIGGDIQAPYNLRRLELGLAFVPHQAAFIDLKLARQLGEFDESFGVAADQEWLLRAALSRKPSVWIHFMTDFLAGGAHTTLGPISKSMLYHRMRVKHGRKLLNSQFFDWSAAVVVGVGWAARDLLARPFGSKNRIAL
jgi:glycosyltransferase involved in cell wall biosynthesis